MVKHVNVALDNEMHERARDIIDGNDWTWEDFIENAIVEFEGEDDDE